MEERSGDAFAFDELLTVVGRKLLPGEIAPDFFLDFLDLTDRTIQCARLADVAGSMHLFSVVNSLTLSTCQRITVQWDRLHTSLPIDACIYTVSMDSPAAQAHWQSMQGILHQTLSAYRGEQFGQDYGVWLKEWRLLQQAIFVIDCEDRIVYTEYLANQLCEPNYALAMETIHQAAKSEEKRRPQEHDTS